MSILKIVIAVGLIVWLVQRGFLDISVLSKLLKVEVLLACAVLTFCNLALVVFRLSTLLRGQGFELKWAELFPLTLIGVFFNFAMPGGVGGDVVKGYYLAQDHPQRRMSAVTGVLMDRVIGFFAMVCLCLLAALLNLERVVPNPQLLSLFLAVLGVFSAFCLLFVLAFSRRVRRHPLLERLFSLGTVGEVLRKIYDAVHSYGNHRVSFLKAVALSLLAQFFVIVFMAVVGHTVGIEDVPFMAFLFVVPLGMIATAAPIAPAGIGVGQAAYLFLFDLYLGRSTQLGPTVITAFQIFLLAWGFLGAYFYVQRRRPEELSEVTSSG